MGLTGYKCRREDTNKKKPLKSMHQYFHMYKTCINTLIPKNQELPFARMKSGNSRSELNPSLPPILFWQFK